jgi:hypothetical protein
MYPPSVVLSHTIMVHNHWELLFELTVIGQWEGTVPTLSVGYLNGILGCNTNCT